MKSNRKKTPKTLKKIDKVFMLRDNVKESITALNEKHIGVCMK